MEAGGGVGSRAAAGEEEAAPLLPSEVNTAAQGHGLEVFRDKLTVHYKGEGRHNTDVGSIQANRPVPLKRSLYYFEVTVLERGEHGRIAIGFTDKNFKLNKQPGWDPDSYGYHGDDGKKFGGTAKGEEYGPKFSKGDTIGAAYNLTLQEIFFTKNGNRLRTAFRNVKGELFPTVGLHSKGEMIRINFGQTPFKFDIEALVSEERAAQAAAIDRVPVGTEVVHQMVRQYLLHYGYGDTLKSFDAEAGEGDRGLEPAAQQPQDMQTDAAAGDDNGACSMAVDQEPEDRPEAGAARGPACNGSDSCGPSSHAAEAAEVWEGDWSRDWALPVRQFVRRAIMRGDVQAAVNCISRAYPQVLLGGAGYDTVRFHLATQQYIELVRAGSIESAVSFAQTTLAALLRTDSGAGVGPSSSSSSSLPSSSSAAAPGGSRGGGGGSFPQAPPGADLANEAALRDVVALVAYEHPEQSPLAWLLGQEQRERVADAANAALLKQAYGSDPEALKMQSRVEQLLRQLLAVQETSFELNGSQGEAFHLDERILA